MKIRSVIIAAMFLVATAMRGQVFNAPEFAPRQPRFHFVDQTQHKFVLVGTMTDFAPWGYSVAPENIMSGTNLTTTGELGMVRDSGLRLLDIGGREVAHCDSVSSKCELAEGATLDDLVRVFMKVIDEDAQRQRDENYEWMRRLQRISDILSPPKPKPSPTRKSRHPEG